MVVTLGWPSRILGDVRPRVTSFLFALGSDARAGDGVKTALIFYKLYIYTTSPPIDRSTRYGQRIVVALNCSAEAVKLLNVCEIVRKILKSNFRCH